MREQKTRLLIKAQGFVLLGQAQSITAIDKWHRNMDRLPAALDYFQSVNKREDVHSTRRHVMVDSILANQLN